MSVRIRSARVTDAPALGSLHVRAWQQAYRGGLMPPAFLDRLSTDDREAMWRASLSSTTVDRVVRLVAVSSTATEPIGFVVVGPDRGGSEGWGEVAALNVDPNHWGRGAGRALLHAGVEHLRAEGFGDALLWVHPDNRRARRFYERAGWCLDGAERRDEVMGVEVPGVRYRRAL